jgi:hypothetical protein
MKDLTKQLINLMDGGVCQLCMNNPVYEINSHLTPKAITKNTYGESDKEEIHVIKPTEGIIEAFYGRQHPQTQSTEIKNLPNTKKGIFCKGCETNFGVYESITQSELNSLINQLGKGGYKLEHSASGLKLLRIKTEYKILYSYFLSIVWRQCVEQIIDNNDSPFDEPELDNLRKLVLSLIYTKPKNLVNCDLGDFPRLTIFTTYKTSSVDIASFANPSPHFTNPLLFFIGPINLLYTFSPKLSRDVPEILSIDETLLDEDIHLNNQFLVVINEGSWNKVTKNLVRSVVNKWPKK